MTSDSEACISMVDQYSLDGIFKIVGAKAMWYKVANHKLLDLHSKILTSWTER